MAHMENVTCVNKNKGCSYTGHKGNVRDHQELICEHYPCVNKNKGCRYTGTKENVRDHQEFKCEHYPCQ